MNVLIVYAHPEQKSFNHALKDLAVTVLTEQGHEVQVSDLYAMDFQAVASRADFSNLGNPDQFDLIAEQVHAFKTNSFAPDIAAEQSKLVWADVVIFQFPLWWTQVPAMIKGWFDRVLAAGFAYGPGNYDGGNLKGKKAMLSITTASSADMYGPNKLKGELVERLFSVEHDTLYYVGMDVLEPMMFWSPRYVSVETRQRYLDDYRAVLENLQHRAVRPFLKRSDYDENFAAREFVTS